MRALAAAPLPCSIQGFQGVRGDTGGRRLLPCLNLPSLAASPTVSQVAKECVAALAAAARSGPDSIKDAAQLALTECTDDVCQGAF